MRVLIALDLDDADIDGVTFDEIEAGLRARLSGEACYVERNEWHAQPVRGEMLSAADVTDALGFLLSAAEVGGEGFTDSLEELSSYGWTKAQAEKSWDAVQRLASAYREVEGV